MLKKVKWFNNAKGYGFHENGDKEAESIDNAIYFYCEDGKLKSFNSQKDVERYFKEEEDVEF